MVDDWTMAGVLFVAVPAKRYDVINTGIQHRVGTKSTLLFPWDSQRRVEMTPGFPEFRSNTTHGLRVHHRIR